MRKRIFLSTFVNLNIKVLLILIAFSQGKAQDELKVLTLNECIKLGLENEKKILIAKEESNAVAGSWWHNKSRFFPWIDIVYDREIRDRESQGYKTDWDRTAISFRQKVLEFGRDFPGDIEQRESERRAKFLLDESFKEVIYNIRKIFFTILIKEKQLKERENILKDFEDYYKRVQSRFDAGKVVKSDVIDAKLDVLNERLRINLLKENLLENKLLLMQTMGQPINYDFTIDGVLETLSISIDEVIDLAIKNSPEIEYYKGLLEEAYRKYKLLYWDFTPDIKVSAGILEKENIFSISVGKYLSASNDTINRWSIDLALERNLKIDPEFPFFMDDTLFRFSSDKQMDWFANIRLEIPVLHGFFRFGTYKIDKANLKKAELIYKLKKELIELEARIAYQKLWSAFERVILAEERVMLSKERLSLKLKLKEVATDLRKVSDEEIEIFRQAYFRDQDYYFNEQINWIQLQENLIYLISPVLR